MASTITTQAQSDRMMNARCRLLTRSPWYGHIAMSMIWIPSEMSWMPEERRTMGVRIVNGGDIQCLYYQPFVAKQSIEELFGVIQHEIEHIVRVHCVRINHRNPVAWNVVCDMVVNGYRKKPRIGYLDSFTNKLTLPLNGDILWIPENWPRDGSSEAYYDLLEKTQCKCGKCCPNCGRPTSGKGKGKSKDKSKGNEDGNSNDCPTCGSDDDGRYSYGGESGQRIDDHSVWNQSDVSEDEARQVIKDMVDVATEKCQGNAPGHLIEAIQQLGKPVVRWRELLRHYLGKHVGNQRKTYSRRNRRRDWFGVAGISHHAAANVCVIIDTSGSIGTKELQQFFAEIDAIASRAKVFVLQWDAKFQGYEMYRRGDWKKFTLHGRGGTDMAAPVQWLIDNHAVADVQVMLTDGYTQWAPKSLVSFPFITVITTLDGTTVGPEYGCCVRMNVNQ